MNTTQKKKNKERKKGNRKGKSKVLHLTGLAGL
jgi:hypothetical protein